MNKHKEQPPDLRDYLVDAEGVAEDWFRLEGLEPSHADNLDKLATLVVLNVIMTVERSFAELKQAQWCILVAAFQMGRMSVDDDNRSPAE